jgi:hypothetical protein
MNVSTYPDSTRRVGASRGGTSTSTCGNGNVDNRTNFGQSIHFWLQIAKDAIVIIVITKWTEILQQKMIRLSQQRRR